MYKNLQVQILEDIVAVRATPAEIVEDMRNLGHGLQGWVTYDLEFPELVKLLANKPQDSYTAVDVRKETGLNWRQVGRGMKALGFRALQVWENNSRKMTYVR